MSDSEVATKAPESDAIEQQPELSQDDSKAPASASLGEHCLTDRPTTGKQPSGELTKFGNVDVYVSKPADYPNSPGKLLLLLTAGTGVHSVNNQVQADLYAAEGFVVIMPDQFSGDPAPNTRAATEPDPNPSLIEQVKLRAVETVKSFMVDMWLARQTPEKVLPIIHQVLDYAKDEYADAVAYGGGVYAAGYCFGARYVIMLAGDRADPELAGQARKDEEEGLVSQGGPLIKAGAAAHATLVTRADLRGIVAPLTLICVGKQMSRRQWHRTE